MTPFILAAYVCLTIAAIGLGAFLCYLLALVAILLGFSLAGMLNGEPNPVKRPGRMRRFLQANRGFLKRVGVGLYSQIVLPFRLLKRIALPKRVKG